MKITIVTNKDLASCIALNKLVPALLTHDLMVFLSSRVGGSNELPEPLQQLRFFEQTLINDLLFPALALPGTANDERGQLLSFDGIASLIEKPILELNRINEGEGLDLFARSEPDLVLSIRYGSILHAEVISIPQYGVLNLHSGKLPEYRGVMATFWAMLNGETEVGTTLHYIDDVSIDTGRIAATTAMFVDSKLSYLGHVLALYEAGCESILDAVKVIAESGSVECAEQKIGGNYYSFPQEKDLQEFSRRGLKLVDVEEIRMIAKQFIVR